MTEDDQYFKFRRQDKALLFVDGNYMLNISRALSLKIDIENLFEEISKEFFRQKTYWYSALESNLDRSNSTFRFLDRLRYISRTKVYVGRLTRTSSGQFDSAVRTDAGIALSAGMVEQSMLKTCNYIILIASDPQYIPAIRTAQRYGCTVRLLVPSEINELRPHNELVKVADEKYEMTNDFLYGFEYQSDVQYFDEDSADLEDDEGFTSANEVENGKTADSNLDEVEDKESLEAQIENED